jgi:hypothetical protein
LASTATALDITRIRLSALATGRITPVTIPCHIRHLCSDSFRFCQSLSSVSFETNSELICIGPKPFLFCSCLKSGRSVQGPIQSDSRLAMKVVVPFHPSFYWTHYLPISLRFALTQALCYLRISSHSCPVPPINNRIKTAISVECMAPAAIRQLRHR